MPSLQASRVTLCLAAIGGLTGASLYAQCADGTPPPCEVRAVRAPRHEPPSSAEERGRSFLILPFRNITRSAEHDWLVEGSPVLLADALGHWDEIRVVRSERLYPVLERHGLSAGDVIGLDDARRVAAETDAWTVVTGEFLATGTRVRVSLRAYDAVTEREVVRASKEIEAGNDERQVYESLAGELLRAAGLEPSSIDLAEATTQSLDAHKAYLRGIAHLNRADYGPAREAFLEAIELDSTFAQAYARLAQASTFNQQTFRNPANPAARYAQRAAELAASLPPRDRTLVRSLNSLLHAEFGAARDGLEQLVASDSTDLDAMERLALLEIMDWIIVEVDGELRLRGSYNRAARLAKRVLALDPGRHNAYWLLTFVYLAASGVMGSTTLDGYRREYPSLAAQQMARPDERFVMILRDTIELVPDSVFRASGEDPQPARARARRAAREWVDRWLAAGPNEAEAHLAASRLDELDGSYEGALQHLTRAESLGIGTQLDDPVERRVSLLVRLGRFDEATPVADSLHGFFRSPVARRSINVRTAVWTAQLYLLTGQFDKAEAVVDTYRNPLRLCGLVGLRIEVPDALRPVIADSALSFVRLWRVRPRLRDCLVQMLAGAAERAEGDERERLLTAIHAKVETLAELGDPGSAWLASIYLVDADTTRAARDSLLATWEQLVANVTTEEDRSLAVYRRGRLAASAGRQDVSHAAMDHLIDAGDLETAYQLAWVVINVDTAVSSRLGVLERLVRITEIDPANLLARYQIGKIGALTGRELDLAQASLEEYLRHDPPENGPSHAAAHWRLGMIYGHLGEVDRARAAYEESLRLDPDFEQAKAALEKLKERT